MAAKGEDTWGAGGSGVGGSLGVWGGCIGGVGGCVGGGGVGGLLGTLTVVGDDVRLEDRCHEELGEVKERNGARV